ncbi:MAG: cation diffusion facilitator family transporter [Candidatus Heimdallarchaeota archaeon]
MGFFESINQTLGKGLIKDFDDVENQQVRIRYGFVAGWVSIIVILSLFIVEMVLGWLASSISLVAYAFHLLSQLVNSIILVVSFWVMSHPATAKTPYGHGRMEYVAPLIMSVFFFVSGIQLAESAIHQVLEPHSIHYWSTLLWILVVAILIKEWVGQFVRFLGERVESHTIQTNAFHHRIDSILNLTVLVGLIAEHQFHRPELDGYVGLLVSLWLLHLSYDHGREAIIPLLGKAPSKKMLQEIRETAKTVKGVLDVHEIIVHEYGSKYFITLHVEVSEKHNPATMHGIMEQCEAKLQNKYGGEIICHTDPRLEPSPKVQAIEEQFRKIVEQFPRITSYHSFRVIAESSEEIIIAADINAAEDVPEAEFEEVSEELEKQVIVEIPNVVYCSFYVTPIYAY